MLEDIVAANPERRTLLKNSFGLSMLSVFGASSLLTACGGDDDDDDAPSNGGDGGGDTGEGTTPTPTPEPEPAGPDYSVTFKPLEDKIVADTVTVPEGYVAEVLYSAGDKCVIGSVGYTGIPQSYPATETQSGGQHDGMHFYPLEGVDPTRAACWW